MKGSRQIDPISILNYRFVYELLIFPTIFITKDLLTIFDPVYLYASETGYCKRVR